MTAKSPETGPKPYVSKIDRRTAITWIGVVGAATAAASAGIVLYGPKTGGAAQAKGYGTDPKLNPPVKAPWPRIMTADQLQAAAVVADYILPATATAPSASSLGVPDFLNEWVSAPYPDQLKDRPVILDGLNGIARDVLGSDAAKRTAALAALPGSAFFKRIRALTIGAYYTTEAGFKDIGYIGNVARASDPGPSNEVKAVLESKLKTLGL
jgi:hypothetical protein